MMVYQGEEIGSESSGKDSRFLGLIFGLWLAGVFAASLFGRSQLQGSSSMMTMCISVLWPLAVFAVGRWSFVPASPGAARLTALVLFILFAGLSIFASYSPWVSMIYYGLTLCGFLLALQFNSNLTTQQVETGLKTFALLTALMLVGFALYDYHPGVRLGEGTKILNPNAVALVAVSVVFSATAFRNLIIRCALMLPASMVIILTRSRTSTGVALIGLTIIFLLRMKAAKKGMKLAVLGLLAIGVIFAIYYSDLILNELGSFFEIHSRQRGLGSGASGRSVVWAKSWQMFLDNPFIGIGFRAQESVLQAGGAHNGYLSMLAEIGFIGFTAAISLIFIGIRLAWRKTKIPSLNYTHSILTGLCCGYLFLAMFERYLFNIGNPTSLLFMVGILGPKLGNQYSPEPENTNMLPENGEPHEA
jgi:O-antigen ligase